MKRIGSIAATLLIALAACSGPTDSDPNVLELSSGTSFGMCAGYCVTELVVEDSVVRLTERGWPSFNLQPRVRTLDLSPAEAERIRRLIDVGDFASLEGTHGCPDCADGGAEWIQIRTEEGQTVRVTFEYGDVLEPIAELQAAIRTQRQRFPR